jgi:uncharacterized protein with ParB-like and HNH nuclease domain
MSYLSISIKEVVNKINASINVWSLPPVQRPYVWGTRYENEKYICKLFDSLLRGYPIGSIIIWNADNDMPYREFMRDYKIGDIPSFVDKGLWSRKDKWLVYDGQQRLQTLYSCLKYTLNEKVLVFDVLFNLNSESEDPNETGFSFIEKNSDVSPNFVRMNELFSKLPEEKTTFRRKLIENCKLLNLTDEQEKTVEENIDILWDTFVKDTAKSIAYFPIQYKDESRVNEVFQRLNTGGIPLSQADLLFSRIKETNYDFEENLQGFSKKVFDITGKGFVFNSYSVLQLINLIIKGTIKIDPDKTKDSELKKYQDVWNELEDSLFAFFSDFIWGQFKINNAAIIPKKLALFPLMTYFYEIYRKGTKFSQVDSGNLLKMMQYLILSQINDWNLQTLADNFSRTIKVKSEQSQSVCEFPLIDFISWLDQIKSRKTDLYFNNFIDYQWFSLKILTPNRIYNFEPDEKGRFNPEIDHIFPKKLQDQSKEYYENVDVLWNMQPIKGEINNFKRRRHPKEFFSSQEGSKYLNDYDFIPTTDLSVPIWEKPLEFIAARKEKMITFLKQQYGLDLK